MNLRFATLPLLVMTVLIAPMMGGCQAKKYTYSLTLRNASTEPLMVGFAKEGPPFEDAWATPEQVARIPARPDERAWGVPVEPGKTAEVKTVTAKLEPTSIAYVRVYASTPTLEGMLAISTGSPNRADVQLLPGANDLIVVRQNGRLVVQRMKQ